MKLEDISTKAKCEEQCKCGKKYLFSQRDVNPEYSSVVCIKCDCGEYIEFNLPVN